MSLLDFQRRMAEDVSRPLTIDFAMQSCQLRRIICRADRLRLCKAE